MSDHEYAPNVMTPDPDTGSPNRRPRKGALQPKPMRQFTVYVTIGDPGQIVEADTIDTLGDWFTLLLNGREVYGAPRDRVLCYTASEVPGEAA